MNKKRLAYLASWLEAGGEKNGIPLPFDMRRIFMDGHTPGESISHASCATACCIAGAALVKWGPGYYDFNSHEGWSGAAALLGLTEGQANLLFSPSSYTPPYHASVDLWPENHSDIDAAWAGRTIRHLIATGEVRWDLTREPQA